MSATRAIPADPAAPQADRIRWATTQLAVEIPSWGFVNTGTRFRVFPQPGVPRDVFEKVEDAATVARYTGIAKTVALHIPWDKVDDYRALADFASERGIRIGGINSNTFQDQPGQKLSYKFGSLTHADPAVRRQAIEHNVHCMELGVKLGARSHTVWIGDGGNFPGQVHFRRALERYLDSLRAIYAVNTLHVARDLGVTLAEAYGALAPGGRLVVYGAPVGART